MTLSHVGNELIDVHETALCARIVRIRLQSYPLIHQTTVMHDLRRLLLTLLENLLSFSTATIVAGIPPKSESPSRNQLASPVSPLLHYND